MRDGASDPDIIERWWVVFSRPKCAGWPVSQFGHVHALTDRGGIVLIVDPLRHRMLVHMTLETIPQFIREAENLGHEVLTLAFRPFLAQRSRVLRPQLVTCASTVAYAMGLRRWPLTPWGLKRELLRAGAERI